MSSQDPDPGTRFFQDFKIGDEYDHGGLIITERRYLHYLRLYEESHPLYTPGEGGPQEVHPIFVFHNVFGLSVHDVSFNAQANLEYAVLRHLSPVAPGDLVTARSRVIGKEAKGRRGIVYVETSGRKAGGQEVLTFRRWVLVHQDPARAPSTEQAPPPITREIPAGQLTAPRLLAEPRPLGSGGGQSTPLRSAQGMPFEDWQADKTYELPAPRTIDIVMATQLPVMTLNNAKPHYEGAQLVYGGCIISIAFAQLARLAGPFVPLGWHTARHTAPTYPGQMLTSTVRVTGKEGAREKRTGLLRLKLSTRRDPSAEERAKSVDPIEVLTMDIHVAVPTRA